MRFRAVTMPDHNMPTAYNARILQIIRNNAAVALVVLLLLCVVISIEVVVLTKQVPIGADYIYHMDIARDLGETGSVVVPHFLFHLLTAAAALFVTGGDYISATVVVDTSFIALLSLITFWFLYRTLGHLAAATKQESGYVGGGMQRLILQSKVAQSYVSAFLTLCLIILAPINVLTPQELYKGYIAANVYHNPTITLTKPLALALFIVLLLIFHGTTLQRHSQQEEQRRDTLLRSGGHRWLIIASVALLTVLSALAKPSFTLCLLPSIGLYVAVCLLRKARFDYVLLLAGIVLPSIGVLVWQYSITYSQAEILSQSSIIFAPFLVLGQHVKAFGDGVILFFMSIAFPVVVAVLYFKEVRKDQALCLAWLIFGVAASYTYLLAESGERGVDGNFFWGSQIALYIVFVCTVRFLLVISASRNTVSGLVSTATPLHVDRITKPTIVVVTFAAHIACGVLWYIIHLNRLYIG